MKNILTHYLDDIDGDFYHLVRENCVPSPFADDVESIINYRITPDISSVLDPIIEILKQERNI